MASQTQEQRDFRARLLRYMREPRLATQVKEQFRHEDHQINYTLQNLMNEGLLEKKRGTTKDVVYQTTPEGEECLN